MVGTVLEELTSALESYRLEQLELKKAEEPQPQPLTKEERSQAEAFLKSEGLMERTNELIGQSGVIGEALNRLLMYVIFTSRKRPHPLHVVSLGGSGTGKTWLQEKVGALVPEEDKLEITTLSENAFYYFGQRELQHKLVLIEDLDGLTGGSTPRSGGGGAMYPLRELKSKRVIRKRVAVKNTRGETRTVHLTVEGPVSVAGCTTKEALYEDNANRSFLLYLDESPAQDERIMAYQRKLSAGKIDTEAEQQASELLRNCQRLLQPVKVINPYAEQLKIPPEVFKPRRTNSHYLAFIEAVTFYHQYQREQKADEQTGEVYIKTTLEDITEANKLMKEVLLRKSDTLTGACRNYFEQLKSHIADQEEKQFTNRQISRALRIPIATVKRHHRALVENGYLKAAKKNRQQGYRYEITSYEEYQKLQQSIGTVLDDQLDRLSSPNPAQRKNEPPKPKKTSRKKPAAQSK